MLNKITNEQKNRFNLRGVNIIQNKDGKLLAVTSEALESLPSCYEPISEAAAPLKKLRQYEANNASSQVKSNVLNDFINTFKRLHNI